ncbi:hypothetical protein [Bradyrhizobium sp. AUGA SZCCT0042]|uniref:hypothetical protein n=1 Tax=Bradyrhizobium sp. AUGA SZCCT0042 TaxID=2807651 RepID=UPI001BAD4303|nr:hypothetical protein [Bradyrhizobium sp. AUGA SZCCT0042]MBR1301248.1 hypothetical protein [Bradyrhizobium sp. AUGA SZCCT0042]
MSVEGQSRRFDGRPATQVIGRLGEQARSDRVRLFRDAGRGLSALLAARPQGVKIEESLLRFGDEVALAIFRLTINSNLVGWITGSSAGFAPFRMRLASTPN